MPNSDGESYRDVTLSFFVLSFVSRLVLSYLVLCVVYVQCFLFCDVCCSGLSRSLFSTAFLCFLLFSPWLCFFFAVFSSAFFALSVALFLRYSIFSFVLFSFCSFLALLWFFAVCLPDFSFSLFVFFFCACACTCTCVCWIWFGYLLLNLFCFDIKL